MNKIMKRPMFRKGGSAGEGITSGLQRPGYANGKTVEEIAAMRYGSEENTQFIALNN